LAESSNVAHGWWLKSENSALVSIFQSSFCIKSAFFARADIDNPYLKCDVAQKGWKEYHIGLNS